MLIWITLWLVSTAIGVNSFEQNKQFQFKYHDNDEMYDTMLEVHEKCPSITNIYRLSENSVEGRPLIVIVFSNHPNEHKACITFLNYTYT